MLEAIKNIFSDSKYDMTGRYSAKDVANYVVNKCADDGHPISNLELQKILYYIQTYFIKNEKYALFWEDIEAWQYGPVVKSVYDRYYVFAATDLYESEPVQITFDQNEQLAIDSIVQEKRQMKPWDLVAATHKEGKAWDKIYRGGIGSHKVIPKGVIAQYG